MTPPTIFALGVATGCIATIVVLTIVALCRMASQQSREEGQ